MLSIGFTFDRNTMTGERGYFSVNIFMGLGLICFVLMCQLSYAAPITDEENAKAEEYLKQFNYMRQPKAAENSLIAGLVQLPPKTNTNDALKKFQRMWGLKATGKLDDATLALMSKRRCGVPDITNSEDDERKKRYVTIGNKWDRTSLTYKINNFTPDISSTSSVIKDIEQAFKLWSDQTPLIFNRITSGKADIEISFASKDHGDGSAFDGPGVVLAHAFFPQQGAIGGDTHFDEDERWSTSGSTGVDLMQVAAHEFGHALGLSHSENMDALMAPFYRGYVANFQLNADDIRGIQAIYGSKARYPVAPTRTTPTTTTIATRTLSRTMRPTTTTRPPLPEVCRVAKFDAITQMEDGNLYVFAGDKYYKITANGPAPGYPRYISRDFPGVPNNLNAAVFVSALKYGETSYTYLFKDEKFWKIANSVVKGTGLIANEFPGIPPSVNSAFTNVLKGDIYFTKGSMYYRFVRYAREQGVAEGYPRSLLLLKGLPSTIDNAFEWDNKNYFTKVSSVYRYNYQQDKVDDGPKNFADEWLKCNKGLRSFESPETESGASSNICYLTTQLYYSIFLALTVLLTIGEL